MQIDENVQQIFKRLFPFEVCTYWDPCKFHFRSCLREPRVRVCRVKGNKQAASRKLVTSCMQRKLLPKSVEKFLLNTSVLLCVYLAQKKRKKKKGILDCQSMCIIVRTCWIFSNMKLNFFQIYFSKKAASYKKWEHFIIEAKHHHNFLWNDPSNFMLVLCLLFK